MENNNKIELIDLRTREKLATRANRNDALNQVDFLGKLIHHTRKFKKRDVERWYLI